MRQRRRLLFGLIALGLVLAGAVAAGAVLGGGKFAEIAKEHPGDPDVVAVVGDVEILRRDIRMSADFTKLGTEDVIVSVMDGAIKYAEARRRGLEASLEEAQAYRDSMREQCYGPQGQECRDLIAQLGIPEDEYWDQTVAGYRRGLSIVKLCQAVFEENGLSSDATNEELTAFMHEHIEDLRETASIVWKDPELERTYHQALRKGRP